MCRVTTISKVDCVFSKNRTNYGRYSKIRTTPVMSRSHIHGSPRRFHYGSNLTDDPGLAIFRSPIRMHNGVATGFDVSTKDKIEKEPFGDMIDTVRYGLVRNVTV